MRKMTDNKAIEKIRHMIEPLEGQDMEKLRGVATRLKQSDGEGWAVGEYLDRTLDVMEEAWRREQ